MGYWKFNRKFPHDLYNFQANLHMLFLGMNQPQLSLEVVSYLFIYLFIYLFYLFILFIYKYFY